MLIWNTLPTASGQPADVVLGQSDFTHCTENDDDQDGVAAAPSARTLRYPSGIWSDGTRLYIADADNNRVLVWTTFPTTSFAPADGVIGQADFVTRAVGNGPTGLEYPYFLDSNGNQLVLADAGNQRVLIWDTLPTTSVTPDHVLGQSDLLHDQRNDDNQDDVVDASPSPRVLSSASGLRLIRDTLIVADGGNNRWLIFGALPCPAGEHESVPDSGTCVAN